MNTAYHLFEAFGVELEYMLVDANTLDVRPCADEALRAASGGDAYVCDVDDGDIAWSNELARHVIEIKTAQPATSLTGLHQKFQEGLTRFASHIAPLHTRLLPTAMHPWMNPSQETELWPHEYTEVYHTFHRIFNCHRHGWSNLQSVHLNLPFHGDEEFARLHAAVRIILPILPALAASSPVMNGTVTGVLDNRLQVYAENSSRFPLITGDVIPEPLYRQRDYEQNILHPLAHAIAAHDPEGHLDPLFLNARGAIARFDRSTIEIRLLDVQECPRADLAVIGAVVHALRQLVDETTASWTRQSQMPTAALRSILFDVIRDGEEAMICNPDYIRIFEYTDELPCRAGDLWRHILGEYTPDDPEAGKALAHILAAGPLARRMLARFSSRTPAPAELALVYRELADCLRDGVLLP